MKIPISSAKSLPARVVANLDDHCHGSLVSWLSFLKSERSGKEWYATWNPRKMGGWVSYIFFPFVLLFPKGLRIFSGSQNGPFVKRSWLRQNLKRSPCLEVRRKGFKDSWRWWNPWCFHFSHRSFYIDIFYCWDFYMMESCSVRVYILDFVVVLDLFVDLWIRWILDKAKRVLKVEPTRQDLLRTWHPDKNPENLKVVWKLRYNHIGMLRTKSTLKVEEGVACLNLAVVKLPSWNEDLLTQSPNRNSPVKKVLRPLCSWKQLRLFFDFC